MKTIQAPVQLLIVSILLAGSLCVAQERSRQMPYKLSDFDEYKPTNCEDRIAILDTISQAVSAGEAITVIARLGEGETKPNLNKRRLHNVTTYWREFLPEKFRPKPDGIILKEGGRVPGYGRLEFYTGDRLYWVMKVERDADLSVGSCYPPDESYFSWERYRGRRIRVYAHCRVKKDRNLYPCRDRFVSRHRTRK